MTEDTASALGVRSPPGFGEVPQRARRHPCPFLLDRRIAALSAGVRPSRTGLRVAARTTHPRPRAALLAGVAPDPGLRAAHRADLADPGPRAGPAARRHPDRADRPGRPDHRAHHRPTRHSSGLRAHTATPDHRPTPGLTCANATARAAGACSDTRRRRPTLIAAGQPSNSVTS